MGGKPQPLTLTFTLAISLTFSPLPIRSPHLAHPRLHPHPSTIPPPRASLRPLPPPTPSTLHPPPPGNREKYQAGGFDAKAAAANPQFGPGGKNPVKNSFDGKFSDPAHSGLPRKISTIGGRDYQIEGADEDAKKWVVFAKKKNSNTLIADFTPKGGPEGVVIKAQINGDLAFPDGNVWKKL